MPPSSSEPDKYSLDEMMERLKGRPSEDPSSGELVTRADGSQAIRVRKRKRRSDQPQREEVKRIRRTRAIQVGSILSFLLVLTLVVGGAFLYTNTPPFRKKLSDTVSKHLGADIELKMFRVTPVSANADTVNLTWNDGGFLKDAKLRGVSAKISPKSIFGRSLSGEELVARDGEISLQTPRGDRAAKPAAAEEGTAVMGFERSTVNKLNLVFGAPATAAFKIIATEASLTTVQNKSWKTLNLHRGSLAVRNWPVLKIDRALIDIQPTEIGITALRAGDSLTPRGDMDVTGSINTLDLSARSTLNVKLKAFNLADLLGQDIGKLLKLRIDSREVADSNYISFNAADPSDCEISVAFANSLTSDNNLGGLHFLSVLAKRLNDKYYESPQFDETTGIIRHKGGKVELFELSLERKTHMSVKGNITVGADKTLSGKLNIGLPESVIHLSGDPKLDAMFSPVTNGFRWVTIELGGTLVRPTDGFTQAFETTTAVAPAAPAPEPSPLPAGVPAPLPPADPGKAFDDLTKPR